MGIITHPVGEGRQRDHAVRLRQRGARASAIRRVEIGLGTEQQVGLAPMRQQFGGRCPGHGQASQRAMPRHRSGDPGTHAVGRFAQHPETGTRQARDFLCQHMQARIVGTMLRVVAEQHRNARATHQACRNRLRGSTGFDRSHIEVCRQADAT